MTRSTSGQNIRTRSLLFLIAIAVSISAGNLTAEEITPVPEPSGDELVTSAPTKGPILRGIKRCFEKMTQQEKQTSPWGVSYGVASPTQGPAPTQGPCTPWYGYGMGVPTYSYGWFGATYRPVKVSHTGYYGNFYQWGYRRGF